MSQKLLKELKRKLPFKYGKLIAEKSGLLSVRRVKAVFNGEVTDPKKVLEVVVFARLVIKENDQIKRRLSGKTKTTQSKKVK